jgi:hypothetical protein
MTRETLCPMWRQARLDRGITHLHHLSTPFKGGRRGAMRGVVRESSKGWRGLLGCSKSFSQAGSHQGSGCSYALHPGQQLSPLQMLSSQWNRVQWPVWSWEVNEVSLQLPALEAPTQRDECTARSAYSPYKWPQVSTPCWSIYSEGPPPAPWNDWGTT